MRKITLFLFCLALLCSASPFYGSNNSEYAVCQNYTVGITASDITKALQASGHTVLTTPISRDGGLTWQAITSIKDQLYLSTVYTDGVNIVEMEDTMID